MDLTTAVDLLLRTIVREERIPFNLETERAYREASHRAYVKAELEKSKSEADSPDTQWLTHDDVISNLKAQRKARG